MQGSDENILQKRLLSRVSQMRNENLKLDIEIKKDIPQKEETMNEYDEFLNLKYEERLTEMDMRKIYTFYCKEVSNGRICILNAKKYIQDLHHRSDLAGYDNKSIIDFIQYGQKNRSDYIILDGTTFEQITNLDVNTPLINICDISPEYKNQLLNVRLICMIITKYKPYDKEELEKYRAKLKSDYCKCINKRCIRTVKEILQPKLPFTLSLFRKFNIKDEKLIQSILKSIDILNMTYLNKYFDAITSYERRIYTRNVYKSLEPFENEDHTNDNDNLKREIITNIINEMNKILLNEYIENIPMTINTTNKSLFTFDDDN